LDETDGTPAAQRFGGIAFVILLHAAIIYALVSGLGTQAVEVLHAPLEAKIIQPVTPPQVTPPPPPPPQTIKPPPVFIPPPLVQIAQPPPSKPVIAAVTTQRPVVAPPKPVPAPASVRSAAGLDPNQSCAPPQYPEEAEDMEQTGTSVLQFLIGTNGQVEKAQIATSSGHAALDGAALQALSRCEFKPAIGADGKPQEAWTSIRYVWTLN